MRIIRIGLNRDGSNMVTFLQDRPAKWRAFLGTNIRTSTPHLQPACKREPSHDWSGIEIATLHWVVALRQRPHSKLIFMEVTQLIYAKSGKNSLRYDWDAMKREPQPAWTQVTPEHQHCSMNVGEEIEQKCLNLWRGAPKSVVLCSVHAAAVSHSVTFVN